MANDINPLMLLFGMIRQKITNLQVKCEEVIKNN